MAQHEDPLRKKYEALLRAYLSRRGEDSLHQAYELGRLALADGKGILDLVWAHQAAVGKLLREYEPCETRLIEKTEQANLLFSELISPYEVSRLDHVDTGAALQRLINILEKQAKRIAHTLHDEAAQLLATAYLELAEISNRSSDDVKERVNKVTSHLDEVREQLRRLSHELRPPILDQLGLVPALEFLADGVSTRSGLDVRVEGTITDRLDREIELVVYRVVQEALYNVTRHAEAKTAKVDVWKKDAKINCSVRDDGKGFNLDGHTKSGIRGLGLIAINERVRALHGNVTITTAPGKGTEISMAIPL